MSHRITLIACVSKKRHYPALARDLYISDWFHKASAYAELIADECYILSAKELWWSPNDEDEEKLLKAAMLSGKEEAKRIAIEVINYRGEHGDFRWKYLLE